MSYRSENMKLARDKKRILKRMVVGTEPPKPVLRKRTRPHRRKTTVLNAIPGTKGILTNLAANLGCTPGAIETSLNLPGWENVLQTFKEEKAKALGKCVDGLFNQAFYSPDENIRLKARTWLLEKLDIGFQNSIKVEGGKNPLKIQHVVLQIPAEVLNQPIDVKAKVLDMLKEKEAELNGD